MTIARLAIFSGFDTRTIEVVRQRIKGAQIHSAFVKLDGFIGDPYFESLAERAILLIKKLRDQYDIVHAVLISCVPGEHLDSEFRMFFPAMRRLEFESRFKADVNGANTVADRIRALFESDVFSPVYAHVRARSDAIFSLPTENSGSKRLLRDLKSAYIFEKLAPDPSLYKEVNRRKKGQGVRIHGVDFKGAVNSEDHPVRRCTGTVVCDLHALTRLGFTVPDRFEFDVSCDTGLHAKSFRLCGGDWHRPSKSATHLNMRINGDYRSGV